MRAFALILPLALLVLGCRPPAPEPKIIVQKVEIPVPVPCPPAPPARPLDLPTDQLTPTSTFQQQASAIRATILLLIGRWQEDEAVLDGYRQPAPATHATSPAK